MIFQGIIIRFLGEANTWKESRKVLDEKHNKHYELIWSPKAHEEYFKYTYNLLGVKNGAEIVLPPGQYAYGFEYILPLTLPSS